MGTGREDASEVAYASPSDIEFFTERGFVYLVPRPNVWESFRKTYGDHTTRHIFVYHSGDGWRWTPTNQVTGPMESLFHTPIEAWIDAEGHAWKL